jgi:GT2 family glycosyltransferase
VFYFVHADVKPVPSFVADIFSSIESGHPAGCYRFRFDSDHRLLRFNAYCTRFNGMMCRGGDQTLYITRHLFEELGGYNEYFTIMEDFDFIRRIRKNHAFRIIPKSITVSARKYKDNSWLRVQLANLTVFTMYLLKRSPQDMATTYKRFLHYR